MILVGNKSDLSSQRTISKEMANKLADQWNCIYVETSAKDDHNVSAAFKTIGTLLYKWKKKMLKRQCVNWKHIRRNDCTVV